MIINNIEPETFYSLHFVCKRFNKIFNNEYIIKYFLLYMMDEPMYFNLLSYNIFRRIIPTLTKICNLYDPKQLPSGYYVETIRKIWEMEKVRYSNKDL